MRPFRDASIKEKLRLTMMLTSGITLLFVFAAFLVYDAVQLRQQKRKDLYSLAGVVANNAVTALLSNDRMAARQNLLSLRDNAHIFAAYILTKDNMIFARYVAPGVASPRLKLEGGRENAVRADPAALTALMEKEPRPWDLDLDLEAARKIYAEDEEIGTVVIQAYTLSMILPHMKWLVIISVLVMAAAFLVGYLISLRLQSVITDPLLRLAGTMQDISGLKAYSVRVEKKGDDEIGSLYEGFNSMLDNIQKRDEQLDEYRLHLEEEVVKRTKASDDWRATFDATREMIVMLDREMAVIKANAALISFLDKSFREILGRPLESLFEGVHFFAADNLRAALEHAGRDQEQEIHLPLNDRWLGISMDPIRERSGEVAGAVMVMRDVTRLKRSEEEQKQLQQQLLQAQKMESIGRLAGGIAHDFNNILSSIIGYSELALMKVHDEEQVRGYLRTILASGDRAASLTRQLLVFSRKQTTEIKVININAVIDGMTKMLMRLIGEHITLAVFTGRNVRNVRAETGQIEQVLMNLVVNARDAMPSGGTLSIRTDTVDVGAQQAVGVTPGEYVAIDVADTGEGMDRELQDRIFEPFFTTKEIGKGTGLGLAIVYGIVSRHKGFISVDSEPGRGTLFRIYLPAAEGEPEEAEREGDTSDLRGSEKILVAEDDDRLRELISALLTEFGYCVIEAVDGEDAVGKFGAAGDDVQLLLFDVIMPKKNGREAYREIRAMDPSVKALFMSGYTVDIMADSGFQEEGIELLQKPISQRGLLQSIRQTLDRVAAPP